MIVRGQPAGAQSRAEKSTEGPGQGAKKKNLCPMNHQFILNAEYSAERNQFCARNSTRAWKGGLESEGNAFPTKSQVLPSRRREAQGCQSLGRSENSPQRRFLEAAGRPDNTSRTSGPGLWTRALVPRRAIAGPEVLALSVSPEGQTVHCISHT